MAWLGLQMLGSCSCAKSKSCPQRPAVRFAARRQVLCSSRLLPLASAPLSSGRLAPLAPCIRGHSWHAAARSCKAPLHERLCICRLCICRPRSARPLSPPHVLPCACPVAHSLSLTPCLSLLASHPPSSSLVGLVPVCSCLCLCLGVVVWEWVWHVLHAWRLCGHVCVYVSGQE